MTDAYPKPTPFHQDLALRETGEIEFYIRKLSELAKFGVKKIEAMVAKAGGNAAARRAGAEQPAEPALTLEEAVDEYVRLTRTLRLCIKLSARLEDELRARKKKAAAEGTAVSQKLDPKLEAEIKAAMAQLADPNNPPTRH